MGDFPKYKFAINIYFLSFLFTKALLVWDDVDSMGDDVAVPALGQSNFLLLSSLLIFNHYVHYCCLLVINIWSLTSFKNEC